MNCLISRFYIKPQLWLNDESAVLHCLISRFYIKPQHNSELLIHRLIALYLVSTSNHNCFSCSDRLQKLPYISFLHQTTTALSEVLDELELPYISFLHQTTTLSCILFFGINCLISRFYIKPQLGADYSTNSKNCLISRFYIKPQPVVSGMIKKSNCLISRFYIKPQLSGPATAAGRIALYLVSTSNHNFSKICLIFLLLPYISFLHQTTTYTD